ncbi:FAD-dependent oxidoreductase [Burkholderia glumae]|uniref:FAD-dependent oxidoreductase n=1 Tax=Burkholderia glumae TaxID=337 RepID=A0AAP9Y517_BURGL|nr:bifunctional TVP38/TMEM64 family protein/FAD-dependent oxidoreductase [Burkholderia glumae]ACR32757.1 Pyridine nucleotide-disulfide oxidoreductase dimerization protein [Burkholderia glumae BGR1]AJY62394.1 pyridine nucleotide-disulfide oxidoreductase family protein [Burkholderia glumae LMG 2196 = ATCC 33617]MCM2485748.1 FAD-dependent oxidoreductase [Burkholderia glumae]MCM2511586.1 FAD-dependent oxidoreductase [Burkholderia glumae]MCM2541679.1 FAD-dependent oxidoreductase [Burkholderia gluma
MSAASANHDESTRSGAVRFGVGRLALVAVIGVTIIAFFSLGGLHYVSLDYAKTQQAAFVRLRDLHPLATSLAFLAGYVIVAALSIPGAAVLTLAVGALFGVVWGSVLVSFASTIGATLAFAASRYVLRNAVAARFADRLGPIDEGVRREGWMYLLSLRLVPAVPFWLVNLMMGVTAIPLRTFYWVSQLGMLPATIVYVSVGTRLPEVTSLRGILSPGLLVGLVALAALPYGTKGLLRALRTRRLMARWPRPKQFDYNVVVIGAGSAGLVSSYVASVVKARVALIERHAMGGDCLNTGCVPSKALLRSAGVAAELRRAGEFGISCMGGVHVDFGAVMRRVARVQANVAPHDSIERYTSLGVACMAGRATITSPHTVEVAADDGSVRVLTTRSIVIAAGSRPAIPDIPGLEAVGYLTSDTIWSLETLPAYLVVLGGGPIGCELAQGFARLGAHVIQIEKGPRLLPREDADASAHVLKRFRTEGIDVLLDAEVVRCERLGSVKVVVVRTSDGERAIPFDAILCAVGRVANTEGYGLESLGIGVTAAGTIKVDDRLQTLYPNIYACGDVVGPYQFTHMAAHQAWYASVNAMFGRWHRFKVDYRVTPWVTFTSPEIARVGLNESDAVCQGIPYEATTFGLDELDRAITDGGTDGFAKVLTAPGKDRILGVTIVGEHAAPLLAEFALAMRHGIGLNGILRTIHVYPTHSEAAKYVAGRWKMDHAPQALLRLLGRYQAWMRRS